MDVPADRSAGDLEARISQALQIPGISDALEVELAGKHLADFLRAAWHVIEPATALVGSYYKPHVINRETEATLDNWDSRSLGGGFRNPIPTAEPIGFLEIAPTKELTGRGASFSLARGHPGGVEQLVWSSSWVERARDSTRFHSGDLARKFVRLSPRFSQAIMLASRRRVDASAPVARAYLARYVRMLAGRLRAVRFVNNNSAAETAWVQARRKGNTVRSLRKHIGARIPRKQG